MILKSFGIILLKHDNDNETISIIGITFSYINISAFCENIFYHGRVETRPYQNMERPGTG